MAKAKRKNTKSALTDPPKSDNPKVVQPGPRPRHTIDTEEPELRTCLEDINAILLQLEPTDCIELAQTMNALRDLACSCPEEVRVIALDASEKIASIIEETSQDYQATLSEAISLIERAAKRCAVQPTMRSDAMPAQPPNDSSFNISEKAHQPSLDELPSEADKDLICEFLNESGEYLEAAEGALLSLETDPDNVEAVNTIFRAFHTIKGTSGFLGLAAVSELAHHAESLLSRVRDRELRYSGGVADLALRSVDGLKELMDSIHNALGGGPMSRPADYYKLLRMLNSPERADHEPTINASAEEHEPKSTRDEGYRIVPPAEPPDEADDPETAPALILHGRPADVTPGNKRPRVSAETTAESSLRVRTDRLDRLIDMVGELVIAHSMVTQDATVHQVEHHELLKKITHAGKIVRELQDLTMSMRMVPLKNAFQKMARLVRDLAHKSRKMVEFTTDGEDTEIDRNMVDVITDPLVHMVRNAIDHGIEPPEVREAIGKTNTGSIRLSAFHSGGNVVLELQDDGRGLDRDKILSKAVSKGIVETDKGLSDTEIFNLIFAPGFSTADKITDISGRGVGMDVVKRGVEALRGRIDIASEPGKGCLFSIRLPLTLAITDGMLVKVGQERYIIPTVNIHLSFRPETSALSTVAGKGEMVILRGELMPVIRLHRLFDIEAAVESPCEGLLVIVGDGRRRCALLVDELLGQQQVVAKSLGAGMGKVLGVSGGAILGDGRVGLILDTMEIIALARQAPTGPQGHAAAVRKTA